jgi:hypothetical protein
MNASQLFADINDINEMILALNDRESVLLAAWERAQTASPFGAQAQSLMDQLYSIRRIACVMQRAYSQSLREQA